MGETPVDDADGYDETKDPTARWHVQAHLQAVQRDSRTDGMYTVKLTITWLVSYWVGQANGWQTLGTADVSAVQRLPVQEVQAIGGYGGDLEDHDGEDE